MVFPNTLFLWQQNVFQSPLLYNGKEQLKNYLVLSKNSLKIWKAWTSLFKDSHDKENIYRKVNSKKQSGKYLLK